MKLKITKFIDSSNEQLTTIFLLDDENTEIKHYSFYNTPREMDIEPNLKESFNELPSLLKMLYNSGLKNENIEFSTETITVD